MLEYLTLNDRKVYKKLEDRLHGNTVLTDRQREGIDLKMRELRSKAEQAEQKAVLRKSDKKQSKRETEFDEALMVLGKKLELRIVELENLKTVV